MDFIRSASNPWGEEVLLGLAWGVLYLVVAAGAVFVVVHAIFTRKAAVGSPPSGAAIPEKVERHSKSARVSHWILAAATFTLLITAFVPILGLQFPWVTIHWIAGLVFGAYVVYHTIDTIKRGTLGSMWFYPGEISHAFDRLSEFFKRSGGAHELSAKWNFENKGFHHVTALAGVGVLITGLLMFLRIDTWFWAANPYVLGLSDSAWGWVYVIHGLSAVGFVGLLIAHIYFALRPDKIFLTRSMITGWITREEFLEHYDAAQWKVSGNGQRVEAPQPQATVGAGPASGQPGTD